MALCHVGTNTVHSLRDLFLRAAGQEVTIGRADDSVLLLTSARHPASKEGLPLMLSRSHAKLAIRDGHLQLFDCGSINGTWCNSQQLQRRTWKVVQDGDVVTFGGPPEFKANGIAQPNPWRFKVRNLHEFLASWPPMKQGHVQAPEPRPAEIFRFSNLPAAAADQMQDVLQLVNPSPADAAALQQDRLAAGAPQQASPVEDAVLLGSPPPEVPLLGSPVAGAAAEQQDGALPANHLEPRNPSLAMPAPEGPVPAVGAPDPAQPAVAPCGSGPDVIDLTMEDDSPVAPPRSRLSARMAVTGAGQQGQPAPAVPSLAWSPHKRREHAQGSLQEQAGQPKRAKPAYIKVDDEEAGASNHVAPAAAVLQQEQQPRPQPPASSTASAGAAAGKGESNKALSEIQSQFTCAICQEMVVHAMVLSCGHVFCGECLAGWLSKKKDCPTCRQTASAPPVWLPSTDSICNDVLEKALSAEDLAERKERKESWEQRREHLERALKAPWEQRSSGGGGRSRGGQRGERDLLGAVLEMVRMGGPMLPPEALLGRMPGIVDYAGAMAPPRVWAPPGAAQQPLPPPPPRRQPLAGLPQQFRVEYARGRAHANCAACHAVFDQNALRIGVAPAPTTSREAANPNFSRWYHLDCMPRELWGEARVAGVLNMRRISPSDQAQVRTRQQMSG